MCGETDAVTPGPLGRLHQHRPGALAREPSAAGVEEHRRAAPSGADQLGPGAGEVGGDGVAGVAAHRHQPLLAALAAQQHRAVDLVEVVDVEPDGLGDPRAGAVEQLQQRPVAQREDRVGCAGGVEDRLDVGERQRLRQPLGGRRRLHRRRRVGRGQAVGDGELVEAAHRHHGARRGRRAQRRVSLAPLAQAHQERGHRRLGDRVQVVDALRGEELVVAAEVATVGAQRVGREAALDREVVEVGADGAAQRHPRAHPRTLSSPTDSMPTAAPTGALVSCPAWVLRPSARLRSSRSAWCQPLSASATA